jgi:hypothetical protein
MNHLGYVGGKNAYHNEEFETKNIVVSGLRKEGLSAN